MENCLVVDALPNETGFCLRTWLAENVCDVLLHSFRKGKQDVLVAELLVEGFVDIAVHRLSSAGVAAHHATEEEWLAARGSGCMANADTHQRVLQITLASSHTFQLSLPIGLGGGTGMKAWPASFVLAEWLFSPTGTKMVRARTTLELGAGATGLPSVASSLNGAKLSVASDGLTGVLAQLRHNLARVEGAGCIDTRLLQWEGRASQHEAHKTSPRRFDVVMFSDAVYTQRGAFFLADALQRFRKRKGVLIGAAPEDRCGPWHDFMDDLASRRFLAEQMDVPREVQDAAAANVGRDTDSPGCVADAYGVQIWVWRQDG